MNMIKNKEENVNNAQNKGFSVANMRKELQKELNLNIHAIPSIEKVVVSVCLGKFLNDSKKMDHVKQQLMNITGRKPMETKARKSVSSFKVREGMHLGYKVTLRKQAAEQFLFRLIYITMPRITDFRGVSPKGFDGLGNYNMGIKRADVFMEINHDIEYNFGMNITICTTSKDDALAKKLLEKIKVPFFIKN